MTDQDKIFDSPTRWVAQHIRRYVESDGRMGHIWNGVPTLLLTTRGRKSGKWRRTALIYGEDNDSYIVVASRRGHKNHPAWYLNLTDNLDAHIQVGANKFKVHSHIANSQERTRLWSLMVSIWPTYEDYQAKTDRDIPVVILSPQS